MSESEQSETKRSDPIFGTEERAQNAALCRNYNHKKFVESFNKVSIAIGEFINDVKHYKLAGEWSMPKDFKVPADELENFYAYETFIRAQHTHMMKTKEYTDLMKCLTENTSVLEIYRQ